MESFRTIIERVFRDEGTAQDLVDKYKVVVYTPQRSAKADGPGKGAGMFGMQTKTGRTLAYWCFSPSVALGELRDLGVRSGAYTQTRILRSFAQAGFTARPGTPLHLAQSYSPLVR